MTAKKGTLDAWFVKKDVPKDTSSQLKELAKPASVTQPAPNAKELSKADSAKLLKDDVANVREVNNCAMDVDVSPKPEKRQKKIESEKLKKEKEKKKEKATEKRTKTKSSNGKGKNEKAVEKSRDSKEDTEDDDFQAIEVTPKRRRPVLEHVDSVSSFESVHQKKTKANEGSGISMDEETSSDLELIEVREAKPAKKSSPEPKKTVKSTKARSTSKSIVKNEDKEEDAIEFEACDVIDPAHPNLKPSLSFRPGQNRGPPNPGTKIIPEGTPTCLKGKVFLLTGILDSLERDEAQKLIEAHGGGVSGTLTKKVTHVLIGDQFGGSKMKTILQRKLKTYDEDELLEIIRKSKPQDETRTLPKRPDADLVMLHRADSISQAHLLWADKYKPRASTELVGNLHLIDRIKSWLAEWHRNVMIEKKDATKYKRALLLSGPPGIGKTTAALILARELGYEPILTNASDARNKASLEELISPANDNMSVAGFFGQETKLAGSNSGATKKNLLFILDEIDGMSKGDKGGVAELCRIIPTTKTPILCIANDRFTKKLQSLVKHCVDIQFVNPGPVQIAYRVAQILQQEKFEISQPNLMRIIESTHGDFRQVLNLLQMLNTNAASKVTDASLELARKDFSLCAEDSVPKFFSRTTKLPDKFEAFFVDYTMIPLMTQDRYLTGLPAANTSLESVWRAADSISSSDVFGNLIYRKQEWGLLHEFGLFSSIAPGYYVPQGGKKFGFGFPAWFGKNKSAESHKEKLYTIHNNTNNKITADPLQIRLEYIPMLSHNLTVPLAKRGKDGIADVIAFMDAYGLDNDDRDHILGFQQAFGKDYTQAIPTAIKGAFTRQYNSEHFQIKAGKKGAKNQDASLEPKPKAKKEPKVAKPLKTDAKPKKASPGKK